jgi:hypothetical protein
MYNLLVKVLKRRLTLSDEELENFNNLIITKSLKKSCSEIKKGAISKTMNYLD